MKVLENIPVQFRASEMNLDEPLLVKTLGSGDLHNVFPFKSHNVEEFEVIKQLRELLQWIATLFDPLGLLSPFIIRSEMLMQEV